MIQVENLVKRYSGFTAVHGLSFSVKRGEIVGFLGPNGAGKSTTMKILSCFMPATSGRARIAGFDIHEDSLNVRRRIGYMPENVPLYPEMRVHEFLNYRAALKGVPRSKMKERVDKVCEQCAITDVRRKIIGNLSKGYRQRVGLADALVHDPELIILDEPTIGLDPNQIRQVRDLIKELGKTHTIVLSTHILSEVEMTCSRVIIVNRGRIIADDTTENLKKMRLGGGETVMEAKGCSPEEWKKRFEGVSGVGQVEVSMLDDGYTRVVLNPKAGEDLRETAYQRVKENGGILRELTRKEQTLEDVFVQMTNEDD